MPSILASLMKLHEWMENKIAKLLIERIFQDDTNQAASRLLRNLMWNRLWDLSGAPEQSSWQLYEGYDSGKKVLHTLV